MQSNYDQRKMLTKWATKHFRSLKSYFDNENPRQEALACIFMRLAIQNLLSSGGIRQSTRDILTELRDSFANTQASMFRLDHADISEEEFRLMHLFPIVWLLNVFSDVGNKEIFETFRLVSPPPQDETDVVTL